MPNDIADNNYKPAILYVDSEVHNITAFVAMLRREYHIVSAGSAFVGLEILQSQHFEIIVSAKNMKEMNGATFLAKSMATHPCSIRLMVSDYADEDRGQGQGRLIHDFLITPWDQSQVKAILKRTYADYLLTCKAKNIE
ncbi:response regulator receiver domain-containing protein [Dyadobacter jejuensis]|uniref:Response regulator receiver domain-containing protein n=1 Tax=Dyadobacter jejuensis TaxID=1082580 RepID=A0A316AL70_9BACT|nr:response regulator [Dyadobacter jejuensis]PWJ58252.1 response regulator receiver domain-containing protein [Dyadobacter jejuensis]